MAAADEASEAFFELVHAFYRNETWANTQITAPNDNIRWLLSGSS